jgi:recombinational DNA repair protein RecR
MPQKRIISQLVETFSKNNLKRDNLDLLQIAQIIYPLFKLSNDNNNYCLKELIKATKNNFSENEVNAIFVAILNNFSNQLNKVFVDKLIKSIYNLSNDEIILYLNQFSNKELQASFLQKLERKVVTEDEIFNKELSENLKLLFDLIPMGYFNYYIKKK